METLILVILFVLGTCFGSFVNMLVFRIAGQYGLVESKIKNLKINVKKRSFCDYCGKQLKWFENVPIVSWFWQKGKTSCCEEKLPILYPIVETATGILFVIYGLRFVIYELNIFTWILGLVIVTMLVFLAVFDFKYMILPDFSTIILILIALMGVIFDERNIISYLLSAIGAAGFLLFLHVITKGKGMGMGDVKYALFMGLLLGPEKTVFAFYVAFISGALMGLILMIFRKMGRKSAIPFGPFLILGTFLAWWWGSGIGALIQKVLE